MQPKSNNRSCHHQAIVTLVMLTTMTTSASAAFVRPTLGGGTVTMEDGAPMKHADVSFHVAFTETVEVVIDTAVGIPRLRPLPVGDSFDPQRPWAVLAGKAYNAQYGWNPSGFTMFPAGGTYWIERTGASEGLEVYQAPPETPGYIPIFGTAGTPTRWKWSTTSMVHNYYAAEEIASHQHWASYRVYIGDLTTGEPLMGYTAAEVTFEFALPGDFDSDGNVDESDYDLWVRQYGQAGGNLDADGNGDGIVNAADYTVWRDNVSASGSSLPEPSAMVVLLLGSSLAAFDRRQRDRG